PRGKPISASAGSKRHDHEPDVDGRQMVLLRVDRMHRDLEGPVRQRLHGGAHGVGRERARDDAGVRQPGEAHGVGAGAELPYLDASADAVEAAREEACLARELAGKILDSVERVARDDGDPSDGAGLATWLRARLPGQREGRAAGREEEREQGHEECWAGTHVWPPCELTPKVWLRAFVGRYAASSSYSFSPRWRRRAMWYV